MITVMRVQLKGHSVSLPMQTLSRLVCSSRRRLISLLALSFLFIFSNSSLANSEKNHHVSSAEILYDLTYCRSWQIDFNSACQVELYCYEAGQILPYPSLKDDPNSFYMGSYYQESQTFVPSGGGSPTGGFTFFAYLTSTGELLSEYFTGQQTSGCGTAYYYETFSTSSCATYQSFDCSSGLLSNPDFEDNFSSWSRTSGTSITNDAVFGNKAAQVTGSSYQDVRQNLSSTSGQGYVLEVSAKKTSGTAYVGLQFLSSSANVIKQVVTPVESSSFDTYYISGIAPSGTAYVQAIGYKTASSGTAVFDGFCLETWNILSPGCTGCDLEPSNPAWNDYIFALDTNDLNGGWLGYNNGNLKLCDNGNGTYNIEGAIIGGHRVDWDPSSGVPCGPDDGWWLSLTLFDRQTWTEFGGSYVLDAGCVDNHTEWDYWNVSGSMTGLGCNAGQSLTINGPSNGYRLQVGRGGNSNSCEFGLSTWFDVTMNGHGAKADIYASIDSSCYIDVVGPQPAIDPWDCDVSLSRTVDCYQQSATYIKTANHWNSDNIDSLLVCLTTDCNTPGIRVTSDYDINNWIQGSCPYTGNITVNYTANDSCGNTYSTSATLTIVDNLPPYYESQCIAPSTSLDCSTISSVNQAITNWHNEIIDSLNSCVVDDCGIIAITSNFDLNNYISACGSTGNITVDYYISDQCGNMITSTYSLEILDSQPPDISACDIPSMSTTTTCVGQLAGITSIAESWNQQNMSDLEACATDVCGNITVTSDFDMNNMIYDCGHAGILAVIYYVTDDCGNQEVISAVLTIEDNNAPDTTGCNLNALSQAFDCTTSGDISLALTNWNSSNIATMEACINEECGSATVTSDFDLNNLNAGCGNTGELPVEYTISDDCSNAITVSLLATITDNTPPDTTGCQLNDLNLTLEVGSDNITEMDNWHAQNLQVIQNCVSDACGGVTITHNYDPAQFQPGCGSTGTLTVTYTISDPCNNSISFDAVLTFEDGTSPNLDNCIPGSLDVQTSCNGGQTDRSAIDQWNQNNISALESCATDYSTPLTVTSDYNYNNFVTTCGGGGSITVEYTITDDCNNVNNFLATYSTSDVTPPDTTGCNLGSLTETRECDGADINTTLTDWHTQNLQTILSCAYDACDTFAITHDFDVNNYVAGCGNTGTLAVTYTLTDNCGNSVSFTASLTIEDTTAPDLSTCTPGSLDTQSECMGAGDLGAIASWDAANILSLETCAVDDCGSVTVTSDYDLGNFVTSGCGGSGSITVTYTIEDECGNGATFDATYSTTDTSPPDISGCTASDLSATLKCDGTSNSVLMTNWHNQNIQTILGCAYDLCDTFTISDNYDENNFIASCGSTGSLTVTYTLLDGCGNSVDMVGTLTIEDGTAPDTTGCNLGDLNETVACTGTDNSGLMTSWHTQNLQTIQSCVQESCGNVNINDDFDVSNYVLVCGNSGTLTVNYTLSDDCGNAVPFSATLTIEDTTGPDLSGCTPGSLDIQTECNGGQADQAAMDQWNQTNIIVLEACATDLCSNGVIVTSDYNAGNFVTTCGSGGSIRVTYTIADDCNNASTFTATYSTSDVTPPDTIGCNLGSLTETRECDGADINTTLTDWHTQNLQTILSCAYDACDTFAITHDFDVNNYVAGCGNTGTLAVTYTLTDNCGNSVSFTASLTIEDTTAPDLSACAPGSLDTQSECVGAGDLGTIASWDAANILSLETCAVDDCGSVTVTSDYDPGSFVTSGCGGSGSITVTYTIEDECGNGATFDATYSTTDTSPPDISGCTASDLSATLECDGTSNSVLMTNWHNQNIQAILGCAYDLCDTFTISDNYDENNFIASCGSTGSLTVTYTLLDGCGNSVDMVGTLTIEDGTAPDTTGCNLGDLNETVACTGTDNSGLMTSWHTQNLQTIQSCVQESCGNVNINDDFDVSNYVLVCGNSGTLTVNYTLSDDCGNAVPFSATLTIEDTTGPDLSGCTPGSLDIQTECNGGQADQAAMDQWNQTNIIVLEACATDLCSNGVIVTSDYNAGNFVTTCGSGGSIRVTYTIADDCNNASTFTATYSTSDVTPPDTTGCNLGSLTETRECDGADINTTLADWHTQNLQTILSCAYDACDTFAITHDFDVNNYVAGCGNTGTLAVTYTLTDNCGNSVSFTASLTIEDTMAPDLSACNVANLSGQSQCFGQSSNQSMIEAWNVNIVQTVESCASDQCGAVTVVSDFDMLNFVNNCGDNTGQIPVNYRVLDDCGNEASFSAIFTIIDTIAPDTSGCHLEQLNITEECTSADASQQMNQWHQNNLAHIQSCASDECDDIDIVSNFDPSNFVAGCGATGVLPVEYTVADQCGNSITFTLEYAITDNTPPVTTYCPPSITVTLGESLDPSVTGTPRYQDCSSIMLTTRDDTVSNDPCLGLIINRTFTATDGCGNQNQDCVQEIRVPADTSIVLPPDLVLQCGDDIPDGQDFIAQYPQLIITYKTEDVSVGCGQRYVRTWNIQGHCTEVYEQEILFEDNVAPELSVPGDLVIHCGDPIPDPEYSASDNCSDVLVEFIEEHLEEEDCSCNYTILRKWIARDGCRNETIREQKISVIDTTAPIITINNPDMAHIKNGSTIEMVGCGTPGINMMDFDVTDCCATIDTAYDRLIQFKQCDFSGYAKIWECVVISRDLCGNESKFSFRVAQLDQTPPELHNVPDDMVLECGEEVPERPLDVLASDDCETDFTPEFSESIVFNSDSSEFTITRKWTAIDNCSNIAEKTQKISGCNSHYDRPDREISGLVWNDENRDGIRSQSEHGAGGIKVILLNQGDSGMEEVTEIFTDSLGTYLFDQLSGGVYQVKVLLPDSAYFTTSDSGPEDVDSDLDAASGLSDVLDLADGGALAIVDAGFYYETNNPSEELSLACTDAVITCGDEDIIRPVATGGCNEYTYSHSDEIETDSCGDITIKRTWIVKDCDQDSVSCIQILTIIDDVAPSLECVQDTITVERADEISTPMISDNCDPQPLVTFNDSLIEDKCGKTTLVRTWVATDCRGNESRCDQVVEIISDETLISCPRDTSFSCSLFDSTYIPSELDKPEINILGYDDMDENTHCKARTIKRTWHVEGCDGDTISCVQNIELFDNTAPVITCLKDSIFFCAVPPPDTPDVQDNCSTIVDLILVEESHLEECGSGFLIRKWIATDCAGNQDSCSQTITVVDETAPTVVDGTIPSDTTVMVGSDTSLVSLGQPQFADECGLPIIMVHVDSLIGFNQECPSGTILRRFVATDQCGNSNNEVIQTITVISDEMQIDTSALPADTTIYCGDELPSTATVESFYNDLDIAVTILVDTVDLDCGSEYLREFILTSNCFQLAHQQRVVLLDTIPPTIAVSPEINLQLGDSVPAADFRVSDNCSSFTVDVKDVVEHDSSSCNFSILRTYVALDACGNRSEATQTINFVDTISPQIILTWNGVPLSNEDSIDFFDCETPSLSQGIDLQVIDSCDYEVAVDSEIIEIGDCDGTGYVRRWKETLVVTDLNGNADSLVFFIDQYDTLAPVISQIPADTVIACGDSIPPNSTEVAVFDDCSETSLTTDETIYYDPQDSSKYAIVRSWTAIDACGNSSSADQHIYVCGYDPLLLSNSISGTVWFDENQDGISVDEVGVGAVSVKLWKESVGAFEVVDSMVTVSTGDTIGAYSFAGLQSGHYKIQFEIADSMYFTIQGASSDPSIDSDADVNTGESVVISLGIAQHVESIDAGIIYKSEGLPPEFLYFDGNSTDCQVSLKWGVQFTSHNQHILLERAYDGVNYSPIELETDSMDRDALVLHDGYVDGASTKKVAYQLSVVEDNVGLVSQTVIFVENDASCNESRSGVTLYPNPVESEVTLSFRGESNQHVEIYVHDMNGKMIKKIDRQIDGFEQRERLNFELLPSGTYLISMEYKGKVHRLRMLKL